MSSACWGLPTLHLRSGLILKTPHIYPAASLTPPHGHLEGPSGWRYGAQNGAPPNLSPQTCLSLQHPHFSKKQLHCSNYLGQKPGSPLRLFLWHFTSYLSTSKSCRQYLQNIPRVQNHLPIILVQNLSWNFVIASLTVLPAFILDFLRSVLNTTTRIVLSHLLWLCHLNLSILYDNFPPCLFSLHATNLLEKPGHVCYKLSHVLDLSDCLLQMSLTCPSDPCISHELIVRFMLGVAEIMFKF